MPFFTQLSNSSQTDLPVQFLLRQKAVIFVYSPKQEERHSWSSLSRKWPSSLGAFQGDLGPENHFYARETLNTGLVVVGPSAAGEEKSFLHDLIFYFSQPCVRPAAEYLFKKKLFRNNYRQEESSCKI